MTPDYNLPSIINSPLALHQHIQSQMESLTGNDKGNPWQEFSKKIIPLTEYGRKFPYLKDNKRKTRDNGWDIQGTNNGTDEILFIQAKYHVNDQNDLDGIVSNWVALAGIPANQLPIESVYLSGKTNIYFALVTISDLSNIVQRYLRSSKTSALYLQRWIDEGRVLILDGTKIWGIIKESYLKSYSLPRSQELSFASEYIQFANVFIGVVAASEIRRIYQETGDSIFYENVRDFEGRTDVNKEIARTLKESPEKFLQLNNGIVFSASSIEDCPGHMLILHDASIINGCQTTVSLANPDNDQEAYVLVKVVQIAKNIDKSQVTHAANFQNEIKRIDLDLARYIRPQVVKKMGYTFGLPLSSDSVIDILDTFNKQTVTWRNIRILFIGLFSRDPGNMFDVRWDLVNGNLLSHYFEDDQLTERVFETVFNLHIVSEKGAEYAKDVFKAIPELLSLFSRLLGDTRSPYMQFLGILATCAVVNMNIADEPKGLAEQIEWMDKVLEAFKKAFDNSERDLMDAYVAAFQAVAIDALDELNTDDDEEIRRKMYNRITKKEKFSTLLKKAQLNLHGARAIGRPTDNK